MNFLHGLHVIHIKFILLIIILTPIKPLYPYNMKTNDNGKTAIEISLKESIILAIKHNLNVSIESHNPKIKNFNIIKKKAEFYPLFGFSYSKQKDKEENNSTFSNLKHSIGRVDKTNANIKGKLYTGTEYELNYNSDKTWNNSSVTLMSTVYESDLELKITQPLLKNFGIDINKANITIADHEKKISFYDFKNTVIQTAYLVEYVYWELIYVLDSLKIKKLLLKQSGDLLKINKERYKKGFASNTDILESEISVLNRKKDLIEIHNLIEKIKDNLKQAINFEKSFTDWDIHIIPTDTVSWKKINIDLKKEITLALKNRPDYLKLIEQDFNNDTYLKVAKNAILPELDLETTGGLNGLDDKYSDSNNNLSNGETYNWKVLLSLSIPWGFKEDKAEYEIKKLEKNKNILDIDRKKQKIILEIRDIIRSINTSVKKIKIAKKTLELEDERLKIETDRFLKGVTSLHDLLEFQVEGANAKLEYIRNLTIYNQKLAELEKAKATILEGKDINIKHA